MSNNLGKEQIKQLMEKSFAKYEEETKKTITKNWNEENYSDFAEKLSRISIENGGNNETVITKTQVRDAYMRGVNKLKPYFSAALSYYTYEAVDLEPIDPKPIKGKPIIPDDIEKSEPDITSEPKPITPSGPMPEDKLEEPVFGLLDITVNPLPTVNQFPYEKVGIIGLIAASALGVFLVVASMILKKPSSVLSQLTESFNLIILFIFFLLIKEKKLNFKKGVELQELADSLNFTDHGIETARFNTDRVNKIIAQLCEKIRWFILFLLLFYFLNLLEDINPNMIFVSFKSKLIMDFFENVFNVISAAFIYFSFKTLYDKTLDEKNNTRSYYMGTLLFLLVFTVSYFFLLLAYNNQDDQKEIANYYNLVCGIYNGWAMGLLFGRLISMEYFFKDTQLSNYKFSKRFFHYGAIFILPIYVLANCLYGVQEFPEFNKNAIAGDQPLSLLNLKPLIFLICFVGKGFFLLFIYHYINFRWLHTYIHIILANNSIPGNIIKLIKKSENR